MMTNTRNWSAKMTTDISGTKPIAGITKGDEEHINIVAEEIVTEELKQEMKGETQDENIKEAEGINNCPDHPDHCNFGSRGLCSDHFFSLKLYR